MDDVTHLAGLDVPGPLPDPVSAPFWEAIEAGRFVLPFCTACGAAVFYPRVLCPTCWHEGFDWRDASGQGKLETWSVVHRPAHPGWQPAAPYAVGLVRLAEGPGLLSLILARRETLAAGIALRIAPTMVGQRLLPCFAPDQG